MTRRKNVRVFVVLSSLGGTKESFKQTQFSLIALSSRSVKPGFPITSHSRQFKLKFNRQSHGVYVIVLKPAVSFGVAKESAAGK